jgi:hypothetical protein
VWRFVNRWERSTPVQVEFEFLLLASARNAEFVQRVDHFDAVRTYLLIHAISTENIGHADRVLEIAAPDARKRISDPKIRVLPKACNEKDFAGAIMRIPIRAIVEIAIA